MSIDFDIFMHIEITKTIPDQYCYWYNIWGCYRFRISPTIRICNYIFGCIHSKNMGLCPIAVPLQLVLFGHRLQWTEDNQTSSICNLKWPLSSTLIELETIQNRFDIKSVSYFMYTPIRSISLCCSFSLIFIPIPITPYIVTYCRFTVKFICTVQIALAHCFFTSFFPCK